MAPNNCTTGSREAPALGVRPIAIDLEQHDGVCILRCHGRLLAGIEDDYIRARMEDVKELKCSRVLADFRDVPSIGSSGIALIVGLYASVVKQSGGRFVLTGATPLVKHVLEITKLNTVIPLALDFGSGLAALHCQPADFQRTGIESTAVANPLGHLPDGTPGAELAK
jgi:anti-anti-sigma factor